MLSLRAELGRKRFCLLLTAPNVTPHTRWGAWEQASISWFAAKAAEGFHISSSASSQQVSALVIVQRQMAFEVLQATAVMALMQLSICIAADHNWRRRC